MTTPPGWYPDQRQTGTATPTERWWDGSSWTEYTRTAEQPQPPQQTPTAPASGFGPAPGTASQGPAPQGPVPQGPFAPGVPGAYGQAGMPGYPAGQPPNKNRRKVLIGTAVAVVVVGAVVATVLATGGDDGKDKQADPKAPPTSSAPNLPGGGGGSGGGGLGGPDGGQDGGGQDGGQPGGDTPADPPGEAVDPGAGVALPLPDGWEREASQGQVQNAYITTAPYACTTSPSGNCVSAGVYTEGGSGSDPKAAAEKDITGNAKDSYGDIKSHTVTKEAKVTVAGQSGYLVRWKLDVAKGVDGTVQSVAFKSPTTGKMVVVRFGFDSGDKAPKLSVMDDILKGIKAYGPTNGV
jgi:Protein of unknown function (DUF2510)